MSRVVPFLLCCWPGLARLWLQGNGSALIAAILFAAAVNSALVVTFVWPEVGGNELPPWFLPVAAWMLVLCLWGTGAWQARQMFVTWLTPPLDQQSEQQFRQAQTEYLRGNWPTAERVLMELLKRRPADAEGRLLLASVLRREKRVADARKCLQELCELPAAVRWEREIGLELKKGSEVGDQGSEEQGSGIGDRGSGNAEDVEQASERSSSSSDPRPPIPDPSPVDVIAYERVEQERRKRAA